MQSNLFQRYQKELSPALAKSLGIKNAMQIPRIEKICVNVGVGSYLQRIGKKDTAEIEADIAAITGQKPVVKKARMSVSNFKLREGMPVGVSVTLRKESAYNFMDKVINVVFPRVQGFRGVKTAIFDTNGNCSFGFKEHSVFPEITVDDGRKVHGVQITVVFNSKDAEANKKLLESMGFPFRKAANTEEVVAA